MNNLYLFFVILISTFCLPISAQISFGGLPCSPKQTRSLRVAASTPSITITPDTTVELESNQFAYPTEVSIDITKNASASVVEDKIIYRLLIHSEDAKSINLIFNPIHLPKNAKLFISRPDGGEIYGAYTNESFVGEVFATTPISGDNVEIQCEVPIANSDSFYATISSVNIGFEELRLLPASGKAKTCETDVICEDNGMEDQRRSACLIIINGSRYCSGTVVATEDEGSESFVLTSAHCLRNYNDVFDSTLAKKCIFFFGYSTPICESSIIGSYERSVSGSSVISAQPGKDMALLKLSQRPPVDYMVYESGWNLGSTPQGPVSCIHHPSGDLMKISISENDPSPYSFPVEGLEADNHWLIEDWSVGVTEEGSSGAPLYDTDGLIIGALSGGTSTCSKRGNDKFWRLNNVWNDMTEEPVNIMSVLDPGKSGKVKIKGRESYDRPCIVLKNYTTSSEVEEPYKEEYGFASGTNNFGIEEFAEKFTSPYKTTEIRGVSFIPLIGKYDANKPVYMRIYTGDETPDSIVYESVVKIATREYLSSAGAFSNKAVSNWSYKENYMRLDSVIKVDGPFFVSFITDYVNNDFAMLTTKSDVKSAFFKKDGIWESCESHPFDNSIGNLLISTVVREANGSGTRNHRSEEDITVYPNPTKETIHFTSHDEIKEVKIYSVDGRLEINDMHTDSHDAEIYINRLANGLYSAEITTNKGKYHTKFIKE